MQPSIRPGSPTQRGSKLWSAGRGHAVPGRGVRAEDDRRRATGRAPDVCCGSGGLRRSRALLQGPTVAVRIAEKGERVPHPGAAGLPVAAVEVPDVADLDPPPGEPGARDDTGCRAAVKVGVSGARSVVPWGPGVRGSCAAAGVRGTTKLVAAPLVPVRKMHARLRGLVARLDDEAEGGAVRGSCGNRWTARGAHPPTGARAVLGSRGVPAGGARGVSRPGLA